MSGCNRIGFAQQTARPSLQKRPQGEAGGNPQAQQNAQPGPQKPEQKAGSDMDRLMAAAEIQASHTKAMLFGRDAEVRTHEAAHQAGAGHLAGQAQFDMASKTITKPDGTSETITYAAGGSVPIRMPGVPKAPPKTAEGRAQLEQVRSDLQLAQAGAEGPGAGEMSGADAAIAGAAQTGLMSVDTLLGQAEDAKPAPPSEGKPQPTQTGTASNPFGATNPFAKKA